MQTVPNNDQVWRSQLRISEAILNTSMQNIVESHLIYQMSEHLVTLSKTTPNIFTTNKKVSSDAN